MKHTRGPWNIKFVKRDHGRPASISAEYTNPPTSICSFNATLYDQGKLDEMQANAFLITAAPELFDCVASFLAAYPHFESDESLKGAALVEWLSQEIQYWRSAIAKATGAPVT